MGCGDTGRQNESQQHDAPTQSSQPPCTQQRDNDDDAYYQLEPEDRVALTPSLKAIRDLLRGNPAATPEVAAALNALENALQGHPFLLADYTGALRCAQKAWKVGGGISNAWPQFAILFPQEVDLVHALRFGFPWRWLPEAEAFAVQQMLEPRDYETYTPRPVFGEEAEALDQFIAMALREGILEIATPEDKIRCHRLRIFSQPKPDGSLRFVMDYRSLNHFLQRIPMKMTGVPHLAQRLHQGDYMTAIDFRKYYRQYKVPASEAAMQMISDSTGRTDYKMPTIGMGHIQAAEQTTRPIRKISQLLEGWQINNINYLDELLAWHKHKAAAYIGMMATVIILHLLKVAISWEKLFAVPRRQREFLGLNWNTVNMRRSLTQARATKIQATAEQMYQAMITGQRVTIKLKASLMGQGIAGREGAELLGLLITSLRRNTREDLARHNQNYNAWVEVPKTLNSLLQYLRRPMPREDSWAPIRLRPAELTASADASCYAWGAESIDITPKMVTKGEFSQQMQQLHHNTLEWYGTEWGHTALMQWMNRHPKLRARMEQSRKPTHPDFPERPICVLNETDNMTVKSVIVKRLTSSEPIAAAAVKYMRHCRKNNQQITAKHISGDDMVKHRKGDALSREKTKYWEWMIERGRVLALWRTWAVNGMQVIDLFSTESTKQAKHFVAYLFQARALWLDAFSKPWGPKQNSLISKDHTLWAFPPPKQIPRVMAYLADTASGTQIQMMLVVPQIQGGWWIQEARQRGWMQGEPVSLGKWNEIVTPPEGWKDNKSNGPPTWELVVMRLSIRQEERGV